MIASLNAAIEPYVMERERAENRISNLQRSVIVSRLLGPEARTQKLMTIRGDGTENPYYQEWYQKFKAQRARPLHKTPAQMRTVPWPINPDYFLLK